MVREKTAGAGGRDEGHTTTEHDGGDGVERPRELIAARIIGGVTWYIGYSGELV